MRAAYDQQVIDELQTVIDDIQRTFSRIEEVSMSKFMPDDRANLPVILHGIATKK